MHIYHVLLSFAHWSWHLAPQLDIVVTSQLSNHKKEMEQHALLHSSNYQIINSLCRLKLTAVSVRELTGSQGLVQATITPISLFWAICQKI